ncbi:MAG: glycosyltransferase family 4 protein [Acidobacteriota bacterium]|nr:glycosyltransferase family 4 protein [Acidobacteriota bacterium]
MRIVLINQFFWPDSAATSQLLTDLARELSQRGHEVYAICADGGGYALRDSDNPPDVQIHRVKAIPFVRGPVGRILSYGSFFAASAIQGLRLPQPDLVITLTTPPLISLVGTLLKTVRGAKHFIWEMDVYPDVAVDLNYIKPGGMLDRITGFVADFSRNKCDGILALGKCMRERLLARGIPAAKVHVAENWADGSLIDAQPFRADGDRLVLLYSGNLGLAHDVDTLTGAMGELKNDLRFQFVFAGGGPKRKQLEDWCREQHIQTAEFRSYSQRTNLGQSLGSGDIGLVTQTAACLGSVVPSKVYGLLAAGRPVLFIGPAASTVCEIIRRFRCGWHLECGDSEGLVLLLRLLAEDRSQVVNAAYRARQAFLAHYDRPLGVSRICDVIGASVEQEPTGVLVMAAARS